MGEGAIDHGGPTREFLGAAAGSPYIVFIWTSGV